MRLYLEGTPDLLELEELRERATRELELYGRRPVYTNPGLSVRIRLLYKLPEGPLAVKPALPMTPAASTLAWYWLNALCGLLWNEAGQVYELHVRKEWARVAGVEVNV